MKRLLQVLFMFTGLTFFTSSYAQNLQISGGHNFSVSLCSNGKIYAWGNNGAGQLGRDPSTGVKYAVASSTVPLEVQLPVGLTMQKVDAGSGATGIALACNGSVWTWGENCNGAIGNGLRGTCGGSGAGTDGDGHYSALQRVVGGEQGGPWLTNITYINASTTSSFAVEGGTGRVLAWGNNSNGELGVGTNNNTGNTYAPRYVKTGPGASDFLTNIVMVEGSDYGGYALSADGYVYSWGGNTNNDLGRTPAGDQFYAKRVRAYNYTTGAIEDLRNIKKITGGDTHGLAIDNDGNLWSWGGDWGGGQRGGGGCGCNNVPYATKVLAPTSSCGGIDTWKIGPWLTNVIEISAGQQHSIALLNDGRVVTFGNNGSGQIGDGSTTSRGCPVYVKTNATTDLTGVVAISDGDLWSFAIRSNGDVYVWGENSGAQLGINGNTTDQVYAYHNPAVPTVCGGSLLPCPIADLGPDRLKCLNESITLLAGANGDTYRYTWYYGSSATGPWTQIGATNQTYPAGASLAVTVPRFYRVVISDSRATVADQCGPCPSSIDIVQVSDRAAPLATSQAGVCGGNVCFNINSTGAIDNNAFDWFANQSTSTKLNTSGTTNPFCTPSSNLTLTGGNYEIWVEDKRVFQSTVGPTDVPPGCTVPSGNSGGAAGTKYQQQFVIYRDVTITSVDVYYRTYSTHATNMENAYVRVYSNDPNKNSTSTDGVNALTGQVSATYQIPRNSTNFQKFTLSGLNLSLTGSSTGSKYWLEIFGLANGVFGEYTCAASYPYSDAVVGEDIVVLRGSTTSAQAIQYSNYNAFGFNWTFTYQSGYPCGRFRLLAPSGTSACPAPVEFLYFTGENQGKINHLSWATGTEINSDYFEVLRSNDGVNWVSVGQVKAAGDSKVTLHYSFQDHASNGITYYKIKETDTDGSVTYSNVVTINKDFVHQVNIRPNPNNGHFTIDSNSEINSVTVYNALGAQVYFSDNIPDSGFDISGLGKGMYMVNVNCDDGVVSKKMIIE
ncbi:MAG: T9SS type A sorting domain-containing protein [Cytophagaceae bacterium]